MDRKEASIKAMHGAKMRSTTWAEGFYFIYDEEEIENNPFRVLLDTDESYDCPFNRNYFDEGNSKFEIYHPPTKKVDMWLWAFLSADGLTVMSTTAFYRSDSSANATIVNPLGKIEGSKITVELDE